MRPVLHIESQLIPTELQPVVCSILQRAADPPLVTGASPAERVSSCVIV